MGESAPLRRWIALRNHGHRLMKSRGIRLRALAQMTVPELGAAA